MKEQGIGNREQGIANKRTGLLSGAVVVCGLVGLVAVEGAQIQLSGLSPAAQARRQHVELLTGSVQVTADRPQDVELRFRVEPGFHINSHTPKDELLIPTVLKVDAAHGVREVSESYPSGSSFRLPIGAGETLDVYQGEFAVRVRLVAARGGSTLIGALRYQACDSASCFPPRTLPVQVPVTGR